MKNSSQPEAARPAAAEDTKRRNLEAYGSRIKRFRRRGRALLLFWLSFR